MGAAPALIRGLELQLRAVTDRHLLRITAGMEDGRPAFSSERLPLRGMTVALLEFRDGALVRRPWKPRTRDEGFTIKTEQVAETAARAGAGDAARARARR